MVNHREKLSSETLAEDLQGAPATRWDFMPSSTGRSGMSQVPTSSRDFFAVVNAIFRKQRIYTWCFTTKSFPSNLSQIAPAHIFCFWWDALKGTRETETQSTDVEEDCSDKAWIICWRPVILAPWKTLNSYLFSEDRDECTWVTVHHRRHSDHL